MKIFIKYLTLNIVMIVYHVFWFFAGVMGFGGASGSEPLRVLVQALLIFAFIGASPNLIVFLLSVIQKKNVKQNAIWAGVFFLIVMAAYIITFWPVLGI